MNCRQKHRNYSITIARLKKEGRFTAFTEGRAYSHFLKDAGIDRL